MLFNFAGVICMFLEILEARQALEGLSYIDNLLAFARFRMSFLLKPVSINGLLIPF